MFIQFNSETCKNVFNNINNYLVKHKDITFELKAVNRESVIILLSPDIDMMSEEEVMESYNRGSMSKYHTFEQYNEIIVKEIPSLEITFREVHQINVPLSLRFRAIKSVFILTDVLKIGNTQYFIHADLFAEEYVYKTIKPMLQKIPTVKNSLLAKKFFKSLSIHRYFLEALESCSKCEAWFFGEYGSRIEFPINYKNWEEGYFENGVRLALAVGYCEYEEEIMTFEQFYWNLEYCSKVNLETYPQQNAYAVHLLLRQIEKNWQPYFKSELH